MGTWALTTIIKAFFSWLAGLIGKKINQSKSQAEDNAAIEKQAHDDTTELKNANTESDIEKAADDLANHSF